MCIDLGENTLNIFTFSHFSFSQWTKQNKTKQNEYMEFDEWVRIFSAPLLLNFALKWYELG